MVPVRGVLSHSCLRKANGDNGMVTGFGCLPGIAGEAIVHQAEERIGAEMFALFGSNHRHSKLHHENSQSFRSGGIFASMFTKGQHRGHGDHWAWRLTGNYCFDINAPDIVLAIVALVNGLFYSASSLNAVEALVGTYDKATVEALLQEAMCYGLEAQMDDMSFRDMLSNLIDIAKNGLCDQEQHEYIFLKPFEALALKMR